MMERRCGALLLNKTDVASYRPGRAPGTGSFTACGLPAHKPIASEYAMGTICQMTQ